MEYTAFNSNINIQDNAYKTSSPVVASDEAPMFNRSDLANAEDKEYYINLTEKISELNNKIWACPYWEGNPFANSNNLYTDFNVEKNSFQNVDELSLWRQYNPSTNVSEKKIDNVVSNSLIEQTRPLFSDDFRKSVQQFALSNIDKSSTISEKRQFNGFLPCAKNISRRPVPNKLELPSPEDLSSWLSLEGRIFLIYRARFERASSFFRVKGPEPQKNIGVSQELVLTLFNNNEDTALIRPSVIGERHFKLSMVVSSGIARKIEADEDVEIRPYDTCDLITGSTGSKTGALATYRIRLLGFKVNGQIQHLPTPLDIFNRTMQKINPKHVPVKNKPSNPYEIYTSVDRSPKGSNAEM